MAQGCLQVILHWQGARSNSGGPRQPGMLGETGEGGWQCPNGLSEPDHRWSKRTFRKPRGSKLHWWPLENGSSAPKGSGRGMSVEDGTGIQDWSRGAGRLAFSSRLRPALGECLARLAAAMPVGVPGAQLNEYNACSVYTTKSPREQTEVSGVRLGGWQGLSSAHTGSKETHCEGSGGPVWALR